MDATNNSRIFDAIGLLKYLPCFITNSQYLGVIFTL